MSPAVTRTRRRRAVSDEDKSARRDEIMAAVAAPADGVEPFRTAVQATLEFFEADKATVRLLFRDAYALGDRFEKHLGGIYERFIDDIETFIVVAQERGEVVPAPPRMVAYTLAALIGQLAHRRLSTDDGVTAAEVADFVVALVLDGLRPR